MPTLKDKIHKWVHRSLGGAMATTALLNQVKAIDLSHIIGQVGATKAAVIIGTVISLLEFLPLVANFIESLLNQVDD